MTVSSIGQGKVFLINILFGMLCVILFDLFYVIRKKYGKNIVIINALDGLYFISAFFILLFAGIKFNFGALRYYQIIGIIVGILFQSLFSGTSRKVLEKIYNICVKISKIVKKVIVKPWLFILRLILSPLYFFEEKSIQIGDKIAKRQKKIKNRRRKKKKTVKKRIKMI